MIEHGFKRYERVHRFDHVDEVEGILNGECHIFEKMDGANTSAWVEQADDGWWVCCASRNRLVARLYIDALDLGIVNDDFRGFVKYIRNNNEILIFLLAHPWLRLYGEFLCKHTIVYPAEHLNKFYTFDIENMETEKMLPHREYRDLIQDYEIPFIKPFDILIDPTMEDIRTFLGRTNYGAIPQGEGVVVKNYDFVNQYGRQTYAKMVTKEFKEMNAKVFGGPIPRDAIEMKIASVYCSLERVVKILGKIKDAKDGQEPNVKDMGRLLSTIYNDIITEEMWTILKKHRNPTINFGKLQKEITESAKNHFLGILQGRIGNEN